MEYHKRFSVRVHFDPLLRLNNVKLTQKVSKEVCNASTLCEEDASDKDWFICNGWLKINGYLCDLLKYTEFSREQ